MNALLVDQRVGVANCGDAIQVESLAWRMLVLALGPCVGVVRAATAPNMKLAVFLGC